MLSSATKAQHTSISWTQIVGLRNRIIHEYFKIRLDAVWDVIQDDIPALIRELEAIVPPDEPAQTQTSKNGDNDDPNSNP